jgi:hypothetical protein
MTAKLTRLTHKIATQLHLVAESCTICSSCSRLPVRKLFDKPTYVSFTKAVKENAIFHLNYNLTTVIQKNFTAFVILFFLIRVIEVKTTEKYRVSLYLDK